MLGGGEYSFVAFGLIHELASAFLPSSSSYLSQHRRPRPPPCAGLLVWAPESGPPNWVHYYYHYDRIFLLGFFCLFMMVFLLIFLFHPSRGSTAFYVFAIFFDDYLSSLFLPSFLMIV